MEYRTNAPKGAALLSERTPGWFRGFSFLQFRINDIDGCVLAHAYGGYGEGLQVLFGPVDSGDPDPFHFARAREYGFNGENGNHARLELEWVHVISGLLLEDEG